MKFDLMIDLETTGKEPGCGIQQIGYAWFDLTGDYIHPEVIYIDKTSLKKYDFKDDPDTLKWWSEQSKEAQELFNTKSEITIRDGINLFCNTVKLNKFGYVWCRGLNFDIPILEHAIKKFGYEIPWKYNQTRDTRSFMHAIRPDEIKNDCAHSALDDVVAECKRMQSVYKKIKDVKK